MKLLHVFRFNRPVQDIPFDLDAVVSKDAVARANARLMNKKDLPAAGEDIYARYNLARPSRDAIAQAASKAMRQLAHSSAN